MIRDFVAGILWGGVVAGAGLGVVSQLSPMAGTEVPKPAEITVGEAAAPSPAPSEDPVTTGAEAPEQAKPLAQDAPADEVAQTSTAPELAAETELAALPTTGPESPSNSVPTEAALAPEADTAPETPPFVDAAAPDAMADPNATPDPEVSGLSESAAPELAKPEENASPTEPATEPVADPANSPATTVEANEALLLPAPEPSPKAAENLIPDPVLPEQGQAEEPAKAVVLVPDSGLKEEVAGVTTGRLPSIGKASAEDPAEPDQAAAPAGDLPPMQRYARAFDNAQGKPLFAILLRDTGAADLDRAKLAALPFAVTFVIDPLSPNAAEAESIYRAAGQEVLILATGIPKGAKAEDLEQTFQAHAAVLPQAVGVIDLNGGGFQDNRILAAQVVPILKTQGRGLITFDIGLNAADQVARRENLAAAMVFRTLDDDGEDAPLIRRYLDRAAFKAAQEGQVVVLGTTQPQTITALLEWAVEGRSSSVALAPASAVMQVK